MSANNIVNEEVKVNGKIPQSKENRPVPIKPKLEDIPFELKLQKIWFLWRYNFIDERWTKTPYNPGQPDRYARSNDDTTAANFQTAKEILLYGINAKSQLFYDGLGIVMRGDYCAIDLDHCFENGKIKDWALKIINHFNSYTEMSPSGKGIRILFKGQLPFKYKMKTKIDGREIELFSKNSAKFVTLTGVYFDGFSRPIQSKSTDFINNWMEEYQLLLEKKEEKKLEINTSLPQDISFDEFFEVANRNDRFASLWEGDWRGMGYPSQSEADLALCSLLVFYLGNCSDLINTYFRQSGLYRSKWEREDYSERVISTVLNNSKHYNWDQHKKKKEDEKIHEMEVIVNETTFEAPETPVVKKNVINRTRQAYTFAELESLPPPTWAIKNHFTVGGFVVLFGSSGNYKSFIALDWALSVATGIPYLGLYPVKKGKVSYIASEGGEGVKLRTKAWLIAKNQKITNDIIFIKDNFDFQSDEDVIDLITLSARGLDQRPDMYIVDTLSRNFGNGDPNSNKDMQKFCQSVDTLRETGATVIVVHHTGWAATDRERSAKNLRDSADTSILCEKTADGFASISCKKQKDTEEFEKYKIHSDKIETGYYSEDGFPTNSLVFKYLGKAKEIESSDKVTITKDDFTTNLAPHMGVSKEDGLSITDLVDKTGFGRDKIKDLLNVGEKLYLVYKEDNVKKNGAGRPRCVYWKNTTFEGE